MAATRPRLPSSRRSASITSAARPTACRSRGWRRRRPRCQSRAGSARLISVYVYRNGETQKVDRVEPGWLDPDSKATLWVDLVQPTPEEGQQLLGDTFHFHPLSIEDALTDIHHPKVEPYERYLYVILHGIDFQACEHHAHILEEGPVALMHRIVDSMVDNYAPELAEIEEQMDELEDEAILGTAGGD